MRIDLGWRPLSRRVAFIADGKTRLMAETRHTVSCPSCGKALSRDARFCQACGTRLAQDETLELPVEPVIPDAAVGVAAAETPPTVHQLYRRPFGFHPVPLLGAMAALSLVIAIVLLAAGSLAGGLILVGLAVALFVMFLAAVGREPDAPAAQLTLRVADRSGSQARLAAVSARAWARAGLELLRIRTHQYRLRSELQHHLKPLGQAVHQDDQQRAEALKQQAAELEQKLSESERQASALIRSARKQIERERAPDRPTETFASAQGGEPDGTKPLQPGTADS